MADLFAYDAWPSRAGQGWIDGSAQGTHADDNLDYHVDLGCGTVPKGRIGVDRFAAPGVAVIADLDVSAVGQFTVAIPARPGEDADTNGPEFGPGLPFEDSSIESIISHHFFEHVGGGFIPLVDELYRVLRPGGVLRAITPLFPSWTAVSDPDHKRYFMADEEAGFNTWDSFCGTPDNHWMESFSVPYAKARFERTHMDYSPPASPEVAWTAHDARELRVTLRAVK